MRALTMRTSFSTTGQVLVPQTKSPRARLRAFCPTHRGNPGAKHGAQTLPIAGVDGTLDARFKNSPLKGKMWAKTGTLNEVNALSGYLTAASGRMIAFSIMINNHRPGNNAEEQSIDRIAEAIGAAE